MHELIIVIIMVLIHRPSATEVLYNWLWECTTEPLNAYTDTVEMHQKYGLGTNSTVIAFFVCVYGYGTIIYWVNGGDVVGAFVPRLWYVPVSLWCDAFWLCQE